MKLRIIIAAAFAIALPCCQTGCSFTVAADGAKSFHLDGEEAAKAIRVLTEK